MYNRRAKFGLKIPNCWGKISENLRGGDFSTHTVTLNVNLADFVILMTEPWLFICMYVRILHLARQVVRNIFLGYYSASVSCISVSLCCAVIFLISQCQHNVMIPASGFSLGINFIGQTHVSHVYILLSVMIFFFYC